MNTVTVIALVIFLAGMFFVLNSKPAEASAVLYKSKYCGCCEGYADYLRSKGIDVKVVVADMERIKEKYSIPAEMVSCHTVVINGKIVEGHVPFEAVEKLMESEERGIALPGMPPGSPGMSGIKSEPFTIYSLDGGVFEVV